MQSKEATKSGLMCFLCQTCRINLWLKQTKRNSKTRNSRYKGNFARKQTKQETQTQSTNATNQKKQNKTKPKTISN